MNKKLKRRLIGITFSEGTPIDDELWEILTTSKNMSAKAKFLMWQGLQAGEEVPVSSIDIKTSKPQVKPETQTQQVVDLMNDVPDLNFD